MKKPKKEVKLYEYDFDKAIDTSWQISIRNVLLILESRNIRILEDNPYFEKVKHLLKI